MYRFVWGLAAKEGHDLVTDLAGSTGEWVRVLEVKLLFSFMNCDITEAVGMCYAPVIEVLCVWLL